MIEDDAPRLANPYQQAPEGPAVLGASLGRVGAVAAGVLAVAVPAAQADGSAAPSGIGPATVVSLGDAGAVQSEVDELCMPSGYLFPAVPTELAASPALA